MPGLAVCAKASVIARILCGAGYAVFHFLRPRTSRGDGAPRGAPVIPSCRAPFTERGRLSALRRGFSGPGRAFGAGVPRLLSPAIRQTASALRPHRVQPVSELLAERPVVPPGGGPAPPESGVTIPARGRRTNRRAVSAAGPPRRWRRISGTCRFAWLHHRDVSRRRPHAAARPRRSCDAGSHACRAKHGILLPKAT